MYASRGRSAGSATAAVTVFAPIYGNRSYRNPHNDICDFLRALDVCRPKAIFLATGVSSAKSQQFDSILQKIADRGFQLAYKVVDVAETTGIPTAERNTFIIGYRVGVNASLNFPELERQIERASCRERV